ncbi:MAG: glycogen/starch synthase [Patescibacteria group bacterium]
MGIFGKKRAIKVLFVTSEQTEFAKAGGLGEVMFSLSRALCGIGHDARVFMPLYATIDRELFPLERTHEGLSVPTDSKDPEKNIICNIVEYMSSDKPRSPVHTYFLENQEYYEMRSNVYGYEDDRIRFALLSRGALEFLSKKSDWVPDVIVSTDWLTGWLASMLRVEYKNDPRLTSVASVFSIHNLGNQGMKVHHKFIPESERDDGVGDMPDFFSDRMGVVNSVRRAMLYADVINTVSQTHAKELLTEEFGEGLEALLRERRERLYGILNGIDYETNDPSMDTSLAKNFSTRTVDVRVENKLAIQERFGLPKNKRAFLMVIVSRFTKQKGFSLLEPVIDQFFKATGAQLIVVGTGETEIMEFFQELEKKYPTQARAHLQFSETLPHELYGGADVALIPSYFEPCGLTQMEAMRFGTVPVARRVGGLADSIVPYAPETRTGTGFLFDDFDPNALLIALTEAFVSWQHPTGWRKLMQNVMMKDFSWENSAREYEKLFRLAIRFRAEDLKKKTNNRAVNGRRIE